MPKITLIMSLILFVKKKVLFTSFLVLNHPPPQQNGVDERKTGHLLDQTRAMLFINKIPKKFWREAVLTASYLINRFPSSVLDSKTPIEVLSLFYPYMPTSNNLTPRIFECTYP
jgi:hypothetical protein